MANDLILFKCPEFGAIRWIIKGDTPWAVGIDVCLALGITNPHRALGTLRDDEKGVYLSTTPGGDQTVVVISEPAIYRLIFRSKKPSAVRLQDWVYHEVLPALRRDGAYHMSARGLKFSLSPEGRALRERGRANFLARPMWERQKRLAYLGNRRFGTYEAYCRALDTGEF
jgi:hypothetical protein